MFEDFTDRAREVVIRAEKEAKRLNRNDIDNEHILLALVGEDEGVAAKALKSLGVSYDAVRGQIRDIIGKGERPPIGHIPFTFRARKVMEQSSTEAVQLNHNYIATGHILLALLRKGGGVAIQVLARLGVDLDQLGQQVIQLLPEDESPASEQLPTTDADTSAVPSQPWRVRDGRLEISIPGYEIVAITLVVRGPNGKTRVMTKEFEQ